MLANHGLIGGKTVGVDSTTLETNAAMRSIVRRDSGEDYGEFLERLAEQSGIATPTREDLQRLDKTRKNNASNDDWQSPDDPDAKVSKMKDGTTYPSAQLRAASPTATRRVGRGGCTCVAGRTSPSVC